MKKFFTLLTILSVVLLTSSCQKELPDAIKNIDVSQGEKTPTPTPTPTAEPKVSLETNKLEFSSGSGSQTFKITSNTSWTVSSDQAWCSVSPTSGSGDGSVTVKVDENASTAERTATFTVKSEAGDKTVKVTQRGINPTLSLNIDNMEFAAGNGSKIFTISANTSWAVSSNKNWCSVSPTSGSGDGSVTVSVDENTSTSERTATITVETSSITRTLAVTQSGATSITPPAQDRIFYVGGVQFKMIYVEGGTFTMGATGRLSDVSYSNEKPTHTVTLSSYSIGETEVTQALWEAVMDSNPSYFSGSNIPVENVSWDDCQDFVRKLNALTGEYFRLPTEAEWEFAARGGNKSQGYLYAGSNTINNVAWYSGNSFSETLNVAIRQANELGLYDMSGNVLEWCFDWYGDYSSSSQTNPIGPDSGSHRVYRGGSWFSNMRDCRVSYRGGYTPAYCDNDLGFRLAL